MNKLLLNITIAFSSEITTAKDMAETLKECGMLSTLKAVMNTNPETITVGAFKYEAAELLESIYENKELNYYLED